MPFAQVGHHQVARLAPTVLLPALMQRLPTVPQVHLLLDLPTAHLLQAPLLPALILPRQLTPRLLPVLALPPLPAQRLTRDPLRPLVQRPIPGPRHLPLEMQLTPGLHRPRLPARLQLTRDPLRLPVPQLIPVPLRLPDLPQQLAHQL
ncbi:hypothetical protein C8J55DRAFT_213388 [Lentinula edodes]|uniref:Uncharacterized protein n=1 Tax=Lentinula lateritia TaxID=40482 RepID=A0A9W9DZJ1_9AGAR|nr:hypothetical protein C8J55DRAFT_213388 [Lentinula edodes]